MNKLKELTLENIAGGAALEIFQRELNVVAKNIADVNTDPKKTRTVTLTVSFKPDDNREEVKLSVSAKSTIASVKPAGRTVYLGKLNGKPTLIGSNPQQTSFFDPEVTPLNKEVNNA